MNAEAADLLDTLVSGANNIPIYGQLPMSSNVPGSRNHVKPSMK